MSGLQSKSENVLCEKYLRPSRVYFEMLDLHNLKHTFSLSVGIDLAFIENGYIYHTKYDTSDRILTDSIQRAGKYFKN